jgi:hypothetical protein
MTVTGRQAQLDADRICLLAMARRVYQSLPADQGDRFAIIDELHRLGLRELDERREARATGRR